MKKKRKPYGYWRDFDNVRKELKDIIKNEYRDKDGNLIKKKGEFPTTTQLEKMRKISLSVSIVHYHAGINAVRKRMGYKPKVAPTGYWADFENIKKALEEIIANEYYDEDGNLIKKKGEFPTVTLLREIGRRDLRHGIYTYHGGVRSVAEKMGYQARGKGSGYWRKFENVKKEMQYVIDHEYIDRDGSVIKAKGQFPSPEQLKKIGRTDLRSAIESHWNFGPVREKMGYSPTQKRKGYWKNFDNVEEELKAVIEKLGTFPTDTELGKMKMNGLSKAIQKYHGGFPVVREKMGYGERPLPKKLREFMKKVNTVKGAKEILACPDLTLADKTDILININKSLFRSREYTDWVMKSLFKMTSMRPYLRNDEPLHHHYKPQHRLEQVINKYPIYLDEPNIYQLVIRKLENIYFKKMAKDVNEAMNELKEKTYLKGVLGGIYKHVYKDCQEMLNLHIAGTVNKIKNPYKVKERVLKDDGTIEYIHSGNTPDYVQFPALHQKRGILHIVRYKRILIADEMGTGKTAQAVLAKIYLENRLKKRLKTLIICPNSVRELWREKIDEYCRYISKDDVITLAGHRNKRRALNQIKIGTDFVIVNYALLSRIPESGQLNLVDELIKIRFDYVVVDEVHNAKNLNANRALSVSRITRDVEYVVLLSGTPIPNRLKDMGMTMYILDPKRFPNPIGFNKLYSKNPRILRDLLLSGRMLRVRSREVIQLPGLKIKKVTVSPTPDQLSAYTKTFLDHRLNSYDKLARLRRILIDPNIVDPDIETPDSGKLTELDRLIQEKVSAGEKVVVYTNFKWRVTDMLARRYRRYGVSVIDGDIPARPRLHDDSDREKIRKEFQTGDKRVLIATIGTMCEGVDLTAARTVIFLDPPFTSTAMDQSTKRVHRLGQSRPVKVYNLIVTAPEIDNISYDQETGDSGTIDEAIYDLVEKKERLIDHVIDGMPLTKDEIRLLEKDSMGSHFLKSISYAITPR